MLLHSPDYCMQSRMFVGHLDIVLKILNENKRRKCFLILLTIDNPD